MGYTPQLHLQFEIGGLEVLNYCTIEKLCYNIYVNIISRSAKRLQLVT